MNIHVRSFTIALILAISNCIFVSTAKAQFTITENFRTGSVSSAVIMGGNPTAFLTAGGVDPVADGWLRLSNSNTNQKGFTYINSTFPSTLGALIDFEYKIWRSSPDPTYNGADGIGIFLFDAKATFTLGGYGGSLGYAPNTVAGTTTGLAGGYIGIGLDEYGNFSNPTEGRNGGIGLKCNSVTLRGPTTNKPATTNTWLATNQLQTVSSSNLNSIDYNTVNSNRPTDAAFYRRVKITVIPNNGKYDIKVVWRTSQTTPDSTLLTYTTTTPPPASLKVGFAASTGGGVNYHEIRNLIITTPGGVRVDKNVDKLNAKVNDQITYTINVYNSTTSYLSNLLMTDTIKDGLDNIIVPGGGILKINSITFNNYGKATNTATGFVSGVPKTSGFANPFVPTLNMDANTMSTFTVVGTITNLPAGGGILKNSVAIDPVPTGITDEDLTNNSFSVTTKVLNADFVIDNTIDNACVDPVNGNTFTLLVSNNGTENSIGAETVTVKDTIPAGLTVITASGTGWTVSNIGNIYTFTRTDVLAFGNSYPPILIKFKPTTGSNWVNNATVSYSGLEASSANNTSSISINRKPDAPIVISPVSYCLGSTALALTASGSNLLWYEKIGGASSTLAPIPTTTTAGSTTYYVSQSYGGCESDLSSIVVIVNKPSTATINSIVCDSYTAPDGKVYTTSGTKTAVVPNVAGCDSTITINLTVNPTPTVTNTSLTQTICSGTSTTLVTLTSDVASTTFEWTASTGTAITGFTTSGTDTIPVQTLINPSNSTVGTVTYVITPTANGCTGKAVNYEVTVNPETFRSDIYHQ